MTFPRACILAMMRHAGLTLAAIGELTPYQLWEVHLSPDWQRDKDDVPLFLSRPEFNEETLDRPTPRDARREKARRRGIPEHLIDADLARLDAEYAATVARAEGKRKRR